MTSETVTTSVGMLLIEVAKAHRARVAAGLAELGLYIGQELLLAQLWGTEGLSQVALSEGLSVEPPTVTKMVTRMERAGLVTRRRDPHDGRSWIVGLTARGAALQPAVESLWRRVDRALVRGLNREERESVRALLSRLRDNVS